MISEHVLTLLYVHPQTLLNLLSGLINFPQDSISFPALTITLSIFSLITVAAYLAVRSRTAMQNEKIKTLEEQLSVRRDELASMRQVLAADFHDETGNLLSVIQHQANMLRLKTSRDLQPMVDDIIESTGQLITSSKDFLWYLHESGDSPAAVFEHLTDFGQSFFNKFSLDFSAENNLQVQHSGIKFTPGNVLNLMCIFKEAMNNVVKHSGATEVQLTMNVSCGRIVVALVDNGCWKEATRRPHQHGLQNIRERSRKNGFQYTLLTRDHRTRIEIAVPYKEQESVTGKKGLQKISNAV